MFQKSDKGITNDTNLIAKADIEVDSEEFCQENYDGKRWIIICSSTVLMLYRFYYCFYNFFMTAFSFLSNMDHFIQLYLSVYFALAEEMASVYDEIDVKDEPLFPSLECDQVCSVFFMT